MKMKKPIVLTRAMVKRHTQSRSCARVGDKRVEFFNRHLNATKGFTDRQLQEYLHHIPLSDLRTITIIFAHYPHPIPGKVISIAGRADEIFAARHTMEQTQKRK